MTTKSEPRDINKLVKPVTILIAIISLVCICVAVSKYRTYFPGDILNKHERWGQFGDFFGGTLNPIFSLLSLLALLWTLLIQSKELSDSTSAFRDQSIQIKNQTFETTFFSMLNLNNDNTKSLKLFDNEKIHGRDAFRILIEKLQNSYNREVDKEVNEYDEQEVLNRSYEAFYAKYEKSIGHYIRTLNQIFEFIEDNSLKNSSKYWSLIRAQLTSDELIIIFYHSITQTDFIKKAKLLDNEMFKYIDKSNLLNQEIHKNIIIKLGEHNVS